MKPVDPAQPEAPAPFTDHRDAARALLISGFDIGRRAGQFCGGLLFSTGPLSAAQLTWLRALLERAGLPPFDEEP